MKAVNILAKVATSCLVLVSFSSNGVANETVTKVVVAPKASEVIVRMRRVHHLPTTVTFALPADATIHLGSNTNAALVDLTAGEVAHVHYTVENGTWLAHEIVVNPPHSSHLTTAVAGELHTHGTIVSYNPSAGLLTIKHNR
jgi:hypothetical protein